MATMLEFFDPGMPWYALAILASFVAIMAHALLSALAKAFAMHELERYAHGEMLQAGATVLMVVFLVALIAQTEQFAVDYFFGGEGAIEFECGDRRIAIEQVTSALDVLNCRMSERAEVFAELIDDTIWSSALPLYLYGIYISIFGVPIIQGAYFTSLYNQIETYRLMIALAVNMLVATNTMIVLTEYAKNTMLSFFLPLGLLLRSFHFTRGVGAFFLAMAIGFYFIFPIFYIITDPGYVPPSGYTTPPPPPTGEPQWCAPTFTGLVRQLSAPAGGSSGSVIRETVSLDGLKSDLSRIYVAVILHPFIVFGITLVFIRQFMYALGGESQDLLRMASKVI